MSALFRRPHKRQLPKAEAAELEVHLIPVDWEDTEPMRSPQGVAVSIDLGPINAPTETASLLLTPRSAVWLAKALLAAALRAEKLDNTQ